MIRRPAILFCLFVLAVSAIHASTLRALVDYAWHNRTASHTVAIPFVALALVYGRRDSIFVSVGRAPAVGAAIIAAGLLLSFVRWRAIQGQGLALSASVAAIVLLWIGGFVFTFGARAARAALFPLLFLFFTVPMPDVLVGEATRFLKAGSSQTVATLFRLTGTPFHQQGFVFSLPSVVIEIADECSGIRSSIALGLTTLLAGYQFLERPWSRIALVLAVIPVALIKNAIRIVTLSLLAMNVDPSFLTGELHHEGGIVFFLLALGLLVPFFAILRWSETRVAVIGKAQARVES